MRRACLASLRRRCTRKPAPRQTGCRHRSTGCIQPSSGVSSYRLVCFGESGLCRHDWAVVVVADAYRYAWEAHRGGHWASVVASGIPFGLGIFSLFVSSGSVWNKGPALTPIDSFPQSLTSSMSIEPVRQPRVSTLSLRLFVPSNADF